MSKNKQLRTLDYLEHILEAIERIDEYTHDMIELTFLQNKLVQDGVIRNIEIIGEASRNIERFHPDLIKEYPDVPWSDLYWMRNRVSHGYFCVDLEIVWKTIENDLPELELKIQTIYQKIKDSGL